MLGSFSMIPGPWCPGTLKKKKKVCIPAADVVLLLCCPAWHMIKLQSKKKSSHKDVSHWTWKNFVAGLAFYCSIKLMHMWHIDIYCVMNALLHDKCSCSFFAYFRENIWTWSLTSQVSGLTTRLLLFWDGSLSSFDQKFYPRTGFPFLIEIYLKLVQSCRMFLFQWFSIFWQRKVKNSWPALVKMHFFSYSFVSLSLCIYSLVLSRFLPFILWKWCWIQMRW